MYDARFSGILLAVSSLPGPYGIGSLGASARRFVDFLSESGQSYWQILPLVPLGHGNSPYMSTSAFAGNPLLIAPRGCSPRRSWRAPVGRTRTGWTMNT